jgi:hypothetical protein
VDNATLALLITVVVHLLGIVALVWALIDPDAEERPDWRGWWRGDDERPTPPAPVAPRGDLPLPAAVPARVRLREPGRLADGYTRPERRPAHVPAPAPAREPERV